MKSPFEYRSYIVQAEDGRYTARSLDGEPGTILSRYLLRVLRAVDTLWTALDSPTQELPGWITILMRDPLSSLDLDKAVNALNEELSQESREDHVDPIAVL